MTHFIKVFTVAIFIVAFSNQVHAQDLTFGIKAGYNNAELKGANFREFHEGNSINGFHAGVFAELRFNKFAIQPEVYYSSEGGKWKMFENDKVVDHDFDLHYVNVPLILKYYITNGLAIEAGPQAGFLTASKMKFSDLDPNSPKFNDFDFSVNVGLSVNLPLNLMLSARYNAGLTNVVDHPDVDWKNRVMQLSLGYRF
ncbi:PorT family protein [Flavobacterium sp. xlx-214]|uniref:porin family protein n=1 Tax=unclassified Flavobacterium TaxID=196869 RepID=UPI0013D37A16|nr:MULTISPECIES: porin family protein [unclassified Flavobacterium]MBA5793881.1 PorT family protein [Flavobacterium sp. xlx-221]QMI84818.1 PorT family protein [Flavobacterium sp. xlx-214]